MTTVIISPHLDDAVLSCGQLIAAMQNVVVENVFAGVPDGDGLTSYDRNSGWSTSAEAMIGRRDEDALALSVVGAMGINHGWLDQQYIDDGREDRNIEVSDWMRAMVAASALRARVFVPLGIGHPDHITVAHAGRVAARASGFPIYVYEELPYRVLDPAAAVDALRLLEDDGWKVRPADLPVGSEVAKAEAMRCYRSQQWNLNVNACLVPERIWKLSAS